MTGIYAIKNRVNGKVYIGQSWDIKKRWYRHRCSRDHHSHLYSAINKYGISVFEFIVLKKFEGTVDQLELDKWEGTFIKQFNSQDPKYGYNRKDAGSRGKHSEESKIKNRIAHLGKSINKGIPKTTEARLNMSLNHADVKGVMNPMFGKRHSKSAKDKMSQKAKTRVGSKNPFYGKTHSINNIERFRATAKNQFGHKLICHSNNKIYQSIRDAATDLHISRNTISKICSGQKVRLKTSYKFSLI